MRTPPALISTREHGELKMNDFIKRHQPKTIADVVISNVSQLVIFNTIASGRSHVNLLLHGSNGTGKTSLARVLIADYFAAHGDSDMCEYINMTGLRDFDKLRNSLGFVSMTNSDRRWLLIDEVEKVTSKRLLDELHDIMDNSYNCSFILTTNNKGMLPLGIVDRCLSIDIAVPDPDQFLPRALEIVNAENITATADQVLSALKLGDKTVRQYMASLEMFCLSHHSAGAVQTQSAP